MSIQVNEFRHIPGKNDAEYIKLLKEALERQKQITSKAIAKIKELSNCSEIPNNWIPCSERLPDSITQVIIQINGEAIHEAIYMGKDDYGHYVWRRLDNEIYWNEEVVAWMPLPEPYQPEEELE